MEALGRSPAAHGRSPYEFHLEPPGGGGGVWQRSIFGLLASFLAFGCGTNIEILRVWGENIPKNRVAPEVDYPSFLEGAASTHFSKRKLRQVAAPSCFSVEHLFISVLS